MSKLIAERLIEDMTPAEKERQAIVESLLPHLREVAAEADQKAEFLEPTRKLIAESGILGLVVPTEYGGMGGTLRDLAATTYTLGTADGSTALAYFFHCSSSSRGMLPLGAIDAGHYTDDEIPTVKAFAEKVLTRMAAGQWIGNFASEAVKASNANVLIQTEATKTDGGWLLNGVKSFGCLTGTADYYLVTARRADLEGLDALSLFLVPRENEGVAPKGFWDGLGMRASGNHGIVLKDSFVADDEALTIPGGFARATKVARGSWVGNQVAIATIYGGIARGAYEYALNRVTEMKFADTGASLSSSPMHQVLIGEAETQLETAHLWLSRQVKLETAVPEILPNKEVAMNWRLAKGAACEAAINVAATAIKMCGTSGALMNNPLGRAYRDASMGLVQAFPAERGKLDFAKGVTDGNVTQGLTTLKKD